MKDLRLLDDNRVLIQELKHINKKDYLRNNLAAKK